MMRAHTQREIEGAKGLGDGRDGNKGEGWASNEIVSFILLQSRWKLLGSLDHVGGLLRFLSVSDGVSSISLADVQLHNQLEASVSDDKVHDSQALGAVHIQRC